MGNCEDNQPQNDRQVPQTDLTRLMGIRPPQSQLNQSRANHTPPISFRPNQPTRNQPVTTQERIYKFTRKLEGDFLQKLGDDYDCSICLLS